LRRKSTKSFWKKVFGKIFEEEGNRNGKGKDKQKKGLSGN
jgi:hypothetical protein